MYHSIVRKRVQALFDAVNEGNAEPVLAGFASRFEHVFLGSHALGGCRTTLKSTTEWYHRLFRLLPNINFELVSILVSGTPWNTAVLVQWREWNIAADGVKTSNEGYHAVRLRWGRMTRLVICPDTAVLGITLQRLAMAGYEEAVAAMIVDHAGNE